MLGNDSLDRFRAFNGHCISSLILVLLAARLSFHSPIDSKCDSCKKPSNSPFLLIFMLCVLYVSTLAQFTFGVSRHRTARLGVRFLSHFVSLSSESLCFYFCFPTTNHTIRVLKAFILLPSASIYIFYNKLREKQSSSCFLKKGTRAKRLFFFSITLRLSNDSNGKRSEQHAFRNSKTLEPNVQ